MSANPHILPLRANVNSARVPYVADARRADAQWDSAELTQALTISEERTRTQIAARLHDDVGQLLSLARLRLRLLSTTDDVADLSSMAGAVDRLLSEVSDGIRRVTYDLTSPVLRELGLVAAIDSLRSFAERDGGPEFHFESQGDIAIDDDRAGVLFRIVRELVGNVRTHARARNVWIAARRIGGELFITVSDDGVGSGVDPARAVCTPAGGYGLWSAFAQMRGLRGDLRMEPRRTGGTLVTLQLPITAA
jgi:signal transduction histidine kinase